MLDLRYHAISLAAVFLALVIGILVGVGISGRGFVDKSERRVLDNRIARLEAQVEQESARSTQLGREQEVAQKFIESAYPALMNERLRGRLIAVLVIGPTSTEAQKNVEAALADADAQPGTRFRALNVPVSAAALTGSPGDVGRKLGEELVMGGKAPDWDQLSSAVAEKRGVKGRPVDGVVVVRSARPQNGETAELLRGIYAGIQAADVPAIGVDTSDSALNAIAVFHRAGLSTVDDVDTRTGKLALALLLSGGTPGQYGAREPSPLPRIEPVAPAPRPGA